MIRKITLVLTMVVALSVAARAEDHAHYDISPYFLNNQLLTGGLSHGGQALPPSIQVYGYEFGEDPFDPYNPSDPGVNQAAGTGDLPPGGSLRWNVLTGLRYWDGNGPALLTDPPAQTQIVLMLGTTQRVLTGASGPQTGGLVQTILQDGSVHRHFVTSLLASPGASNVPGDPGFLQPPQGIYAFGLELTLGYQNQTYVSPPLWVVFNNGLSEDAHDQMMDYIGNTVLPEPATLSLLGLIGLALRRRR